MKRLFLLVFVFSIWIMGCFAQSRVTVKGQILDIDTNVPIAGVRVYVKGDTTVQTLSNTKGYFELITDGSKIIFLTKKYKHSIHSVADINKTGKIYLKKYVPTDVPALVIKTKEGQDITSKVEKQSVNGINLPKDEWCLTNASILLNVGYYYMANGKIKVEYEY